MDYGKHMEKRMEARVKKGVVKGFKILAMIVLAILFFLLAGYVLQLLWNWLMPELFGLPTVTYWQAFGLLILAKLLFGLGSHSSNGKKDHSRKQRMKARCKGWEESKDKWQFYDRFWTEEGAAAFDDYIARQQHGKTRETEDDDTPADR